MLLPSHQLEAFFEVARTRNFSQAAQKLHITQSALSQRIQNLESTLELTLFIRHASGVRLTSAGESLLRHCQVRRGLEQELLQELKGRRPDELGGSIRIGGFSSIMWSIVVPALGDLVRANPALHIETLARELGDLPRLLQVGEVDFAIVDHPIERTDIENVLLGYEENVLVEPLDAGGRGDCYIDNDVDDKTTMTFLKQQGEKSTKLNRIFMDDIHGIVAALSEGWGRAVIPRHFVDQCRNVRIVDERESLAIPVYLHYYAQPYYPKLHQAFKEALVEGCRARLGRGKGRK